MTELEDKIYRIIRKEGPVLPVHISRRTAQGTMLISAILTSMVKRNKINKTQQKIGSSSLYFIDSQKDKALEKIQEEMSDLEKKVYRFLKKRKVIRDKEAGARRRAVLRKIRDFAKDFEHRDEKYWRFHTLSENQAISIIRKRTAEKLEGEGEEVEEKARDEEREKTEEVEEVEEKVEAKPGRKTEEEIEEGKEKRKEKEKLGKTEKGKEEVSFEEKITNFLKNKGAEIVEKDVIRKRYEINLVIKAQSLFGERKFFVKARSKKRINEQELSLAYLEGNEKKMPTIFLTDGGLTNKAKEYAKKELGSVFKIVKL